jgi:hypothetical protein
MAYGRPVLPDCINFALLAARLNMRESGHGGIIRSADVTYWLGLRVCSFLGYRFSEPQPK